MEILTKNFWPKITRAAKTSQKGYVAVAYLSTGASTQLPLASGSVLVVNASEAVVSAGATNPYEIIKFLEKGVHVFHNENLHAKVYVLDTQVWVGSANVSERSRSKLVECMAYSSSLSTVKETRKFINDIAIKPIGPEYAQYLTGKYKPPKTSTLKPENALWIQELVDYEYSQEEQAVHDANVEKLKRVLTSSDYYVNSVRYRPRATFAKQVVVGDTLIQMNGKWVDSPVTVIGKAACHATDTILIFVEEKYGSKRKRRSGFESAMQKIGIRLKSRKYPKQSNIDDILRIWK